jgi:hypothetical protein
MIAKDYLPLIKSLSMFIASMKRYGMSDTQLNFSENL